jgi:hypothetical protein
MTTACDEKLSCWKWSKKKFELIIFMGLKCQTRTVGVPESSLSWRAHYSISIVNASVILCLNAMWVSISKPLALNRLLLHLLREIFTQAASSTFRRGRSRHHLGFVLKQGNTNINFTGQQFSEIDGQTKREKTLFESWNFALNRICSGLSGAVVNVADCHSKRCWFRFPGNAWISL